MTRSTSPATRLARAVRLTLSGVAHLVVACVGVLAAWALVVLFVWAATVGR